MSQRSSLSSICIVIMVAVCAAMPAQANAPMGQYTASMGTVTDTKTGLTWQQTPTPVSYNWLNAKTYCTGLDLNGTGWRLPTVKELFTLVDHSKASFTIDTSVNGFPVVSGFFWSSTPLAGPQAPPTAWLVGFSAGGTNLDFLTSTSRVRCVR